MGKFIVILVLTWSVAIKAEPPVSNCLPSNHQNGGPSATYGPPGFQPGTPLGGRHPDSDQRPGTSYMPQNGGGGTKYRPFGGGNGGGNGRKLSNTYGVAGRSELGGGNGFGGGTIGGGTNGGGRTQFNGAPGAENSGGGRPSSTRGGNGFGGSSNGGGRPSSTYGGGDNGGGFNGTPSSTYGVPNHGGIGGRGNGGLGRSYLLPPQNGGLGGYPTGGIGENGGYPGEEEATEPARYQFQFEVNDQQFGAQFGHQESRDGDRSSGEYNVLLPDGRRQIVQYEADSEGYKPNISYEGGNGGGGGYPSGGPVGNYPSSVNGGYSSGNGGATY